MINLEEFLLKNIHKDKVGCYALVGYNGTVEATWFSNFCGLIDGNIFFLESPCELYKAFEVGDSVDKFCKEYMKGLDFLDGATEENTERDYIENFVKPMIHNGWFYEINNFQTDPYLPKEVDDIKLISERECLMWLLENQKEN